MTSPTPDPTSGVLLNLSISFLKRTLPTGLGWLVKKVAGKRLLIVGKERAGKTSFTNYLVHGVLCNEGEQAKTQDIKASPTFSVDIGGNGLLSLTCSNATEIPGQYGAEIQAKMTFEREPDILLVFLDLSTPDLSLQWLRNFCQCFEDQWRSNTNNKLASLIIVMNKYDKANPNILTQVREEAAQIVRNNLSYGRGRIPVDNIQLMPCISVNNSEQSKYLDDIIKRIALDIQ